MFYDKELLMRVPAMKSGTVDLEAAKRTIEKMIKRFPEGTVRKPSIDNRHGLQTLYADLVPGSPSASRPSDLVMTAKDGYLIGSVYRCFQENGTSLIKTVDRAFKKVGDSISHIVETRINSRLRGFWAMNESSAVAPFRNAMNGSTSHMEGDVLHVKLSRSSLDEAGSQCTTFVSKMDNKGMELVKAGWLFKAGEDKPVKIQRSIVPLTKESFGWFTPEGIRASVIDGYSGAVRWTDMERA